MPFPPPSPGGGINQLTGDVTAGPGTGSQAATLASAGTAGTYGSGQLVPVITTDSKGRVTGVTTAAPDDTTKVPLAGGTMTGQLVVPDLSVGGLTGATAASRYVGATTSGAPTTGTFSVGDFVIDQTGKVWVCTTAGTPGTWTGVGGAALTYASSYLTSPLAMTTANANYNIASVSLEAGTWLVTGQITFNSGSGIVMHVAVGPTSASLLGQAGFAEVVSNTNSSPYSITASGVMTLTGAGTAYLVGQTGIANAVAEGSSTYQMSGIYAVKIA